jgi:hypothetical protein
VAELEIDRPLWEESEMQAFSFAMTGFAVATLVVAAQPQDKVLTATVTIKTVGRTTAVHGKVADPKQGDFLFCIDQEQTGAAKAINFTGEGRVIYRPMPVPGIPESMLAKTPESVANALTVVAGTGETWLFVAKGQTALQPPGNASRSTTIPVGIVRKTDWSPGTGPRRGTDISSCLAVAG